MKITVRETTKEDLPHIFRVEKRSYPPWLQASQDVLRQRLEAFKILVAVEKISGVEYVRGFTTLVPAMVSWREMPSVARKVIQNRHPSYLPWLAEYANEGEFNTLWVASTAVESRHQKKGIGAKLIQASLRLAKRMGLSHRASALKTEYHKKRVGSESIEEYLERIKQGRVKDRFLQPYLKLGFELGPVLPDYEAAHPKTPRELNYNVLAFKRI